jgi:uncharacterized damage-inducible protein DinB
MVSAMDVLSVFRRLAECNAWSNHRLHAACARLSKNDFDERRTSFFPSIPMTLNHILIVDWYYLDALEKGGKGRALFANEVPFPDMPALARAQREADQRLVAFAASLREASALGEIVSLERADHVQKESVGDVLLHLHDHQVHHRGQVHAMLAGTPVRPPQLDEFFMREELPLREAELRELGLPLA